MRLERIAGAWQDRSSNGFWRRGGDDEDPRRRQMDIFLAEPLSGGPMVPVRAEGLSSVGPILSTFVPPLGWLGMPPRRGRRIAPAGG